VRFSGFSYECQFACNQTSLSINGLALRSKVLIRAILFAKVNVRFVPIETPGGFFEVPRDRRHGTLAIRQEAGQSEK
jgi:hypothetical protein